MPLFRWLISHPDRFNYNQKCWLFLLITFPSELNVMPSHLSFHFYQSASVSCTEEFGASSLGLLSFVLMYICISSYCFLKQTRQQDYGWAKQLLSTTRQLKQPKLLFEYKWEASRKVCKHKSCAEGEDKLLHHTQTRGLSAGKIAAGFHQLWPLCLLLDSELISWKLKIFVHVLGAHSKCVVQKWLELCGPWVMHTLRSHLRKNVFDLYLCSCHVRCCLTTALLIGRL